MRPVSLQFENPGSAVPWGGVKTVDLRSVWGHRHMILYYIVKWYIRHSIIYFDPEPAGLDASLPVSR